MYKLIFFFFFLRLFFFFFFQAEDGIRDIGVTGVQTCALPISRRCRPSRCPRDSIAKVDTGRADIGLADSAVVIAAVSRGGKIKVVGMVFDKTPLNIWSRKEAPRSEERRVGKECRNWWMPRHQR